MLRFPCAIAALLAASGFAADSHLDNFRQLTHGGQNAEAYWAPDGKRLIFQSTRPPNECDQMYIMNADGSDQHMVSNGKGRTTCGFFLPDNKHIVYASTYEASPACPTPPDRSKGYAWGVFPAYDIYLATDDGKILKNLTHSPGYDAEATVNYRTKRIIYTSLASGDLDLWTMDIDGSNKKQVTSAIGYDGGADFSPDGTRIAWRGNHPSTPETMARYKDLLSNNLVTPMKMELMIADSDGKNMKEITDYGCASFAPAFTNDGKKIVFASNKLNCDGRKFELFMVNVNGTGLEQITNFGGFTSFADISPDGKKLVFVSDYNAKERYEFNVFTADWK